MSDTLSHPPVAAQGAPGAHAARGSTPGHRRTRVARRLSPRSSWLTALAFVVVALPFVVALVQFARQSGAHLTLADDLALIDLHTRRALAWKQQLGVFDRNDWNHPGPSYFYLLSIVYRILGGGARSLFIGATVLNGLSALACVLVVRYRSTPARALWAAVWICALIAVLAASGHGSTTYSESVLGGLVSPWNPMVVTLPLLLTVLLCAAAVDRSGLSLLAAVATGSFVVQTNISTLPVVAVIGGCAALVWGGSSLYDLVRLWTGAGAETRRRSWMGRRHWIVGPLLAVGALAVVVVMWLPPLAQQRSNHPGNLTLIFRFFNGHHGTYPLGVGWKALLSVDGTLLQGPGGVMRTYLGFGVPHAGVAWTATVLTGLAAMIAVVVGAVQRNRFAIGIGLLVLAGSAAVVVSATHVVGYIFGYLLVWAVVLPVAALVGPGLLTVPRRRHPWSEAPARPVTASTGLRLALCAAAVAVCVLAVVRVTAIPPLTHASDPTVGRLAALVTPYLEPGGRVFVGDGGAGTVDTKLLDTEEFIGLVNLLDQNGFRPTVNHVWRTEFGPGYQTTGREARQVNLTTWDPTSPTLPGYVGRAGDMAVTVTDSTGAPVGRTP
ncbi:MAG TPA: hypothetical protein VII96_01830 [Acidimicrobiales bacterium]